MQDHERPIMECLASREADLQRLLDRLANHDYDEEAHDEWHDYALSIEPKIHVTVFLAIFGPTEDSGVINPREDYDHAWIFAGYDGADGWCDKGGYHRYAESIGDVYRAERRAHGEPILAVPFYAGDDYYSEAKWDRANLIAYIQVSAIEHEWSGTWAEKCKKARECLQSELAELRAWRRGEVYGYVVEGPEGQHDSCWGFIGDDEYCRQEAESVAEHIEFERACRWAEAPEWVKARVLIEQGEFFPIGHAGQQLLIDGRGVTL